MNIVDEDKEAIIYLIGLAKSLSNWIQHRLNSDAIRIHTNDPYDLSTLWPEIKRLKEIEDYLYKYHRILING